ncbi:MAG: glycerophosphodiester phosphodiesterase family protein [bacterium]
MHFRELWKPRGTIMLALFCLVTLCSGLPAGVCADTQPDLQLNLLRIEAGGLTALEAIHLFEQHAWQPTVTAVSVNKDNGSPVFTVEAVDNEEHYTARVDAQRSRLVSVEVNGEANWHWDGIRVVAHRGAATFGPENTMAAFDKAIALGVDYIEIDIRETRDGHFVIMHDETVDRTTNGTGKVSDLTLEDIQHLEAGAWFAREFEGEPILTLKETLETFRGRVGANLDFKQGSPERLVELLRSEEAANPGFLEYTTFNSHTPELLRQVLDLESRLLARPIVHHGNAGLSTLLKEFDPELVNINSWDLTEELVRNTHLAGKKAFVSILGKYDAPWGMQLAIDIGADYIQTDHPDILLTILRSQGLHK